jgi:hypothetical protein
MSEATKTPAPTTPAVEPHAKKVPPQFLTKDAFRKRYALRQRIITTKDGSNFRITQIPLSNKRTIRENNMTLTFGAGRGEDRESSAALDVEGMMLDTIIACTLEPNFSEDDKVWMEEQTDAAIWQDLYEQIETPAKLVDTDDPTVAGN